MKVINLLVLLLLGLPIAAAAATNSEPTTKAPSVISSPRIASDTNHPVSSLAGETKALRDARMAWWRDAKFGMFVHWGVYSVPAGWYHGRRFKGFSEWLMHDAEIPVREYRKYATEFHPAGFDAASFVSAAKSAGMKYIVITAKHHDGFAMFDSKASDWNVVKASPGGRDTLKELAQECRRQGIKLGFYYSHAQDWINGGAVGLSMPKKPEDFRGPWDKQQIHDMDDYIDRIAIPQIREILGNYGSDTPAVLWWDTPKNIDLARAARIESAVQKLKPGIIQNNRLCNTKNASGRKCFPGDTETPEGVIPAQGYPGRDWETCMTFNDSWGYKRGDNHWKSTRTLVRNLVDIASKGGNYLLNVGPDAEGKIPEESLKRLAAVGSWMKVNGEAIYGTGPTPFGEEAGRFSTWRRDREGKRLFIPAWEWRSTVKPGHLYLIVFKWPRSGVFKIPPFARTITGARLLSDASVKLTFSQDDKGVKVSGLPKKAPDSIASVIDLKY